MKKGLITFSLICILMGQAWAQLSLTAPSLRLMAEWEESEYVVLSWAREFETLREIVRHAKEEAKVLIICRDSLRVQSYLSKGLLDLDNVSFLHAPFNSIWARDYAGVSAYNQEVGQMHIVDWIYNRPRPNDDRIPRHLANYLNTAHADMESYPYDLVHIGGNFMTDGRGLALSTQLLLDENGGMSRFAENLKSPDAVWELLKNRLGIYQYLPLPKLPFDPIHHLDMHLKLLNEETILLGEYPEGIADGDQIEANLEYLLKNFPTPSGQAWKVIRIPMPADGGFYPDSPGAWYQTYTNAVFINKMLLVPQYKCPQDSVAIEILEEALPGYKIIGIDARALIKSAGAIHCVTSNVGVKKPLLIQHSPQQDLPFAKREIYLEARILHESGIKSANLYFQLNGKGDFQKLPMISSTKDPHLYFAYIAQQAPGSSIRYYFQAEAHSGKEMMRPMPAPEGYFEFKILPKKRNLPR